MSLSDFNINLLPEVVNKFQELIEYAKSTEPHKGWIVCSEVKKSTESNIEGEGEGEQKKRCLPKI